MVEATSNNVRFSKIQPNFGVTSPVGGGAIA